MNNPATMLQNREYMTRLYRHRSIIALICCVLLLILTFYGIVAGVIRTIEKLGENGFFSFIYFTMIVNTFSAFTAAMMLPFTINGIRKKRFILPRWLAVIHYLATCSIMFMMFFVLAFMSWASPDDAFGGSNLIVHVFSPVLILILFFQMENEHIFSVKDRFLGCTPFVTYLIVYFCKVVLIGRKNGGWPDIYRITRQPVPLPVSVLLLLLLSFGISTAIAICSNALTLRRRDKMFLFWKEDTDPVEIRIEAYGLGRMEGMEGTNDVILVPMDILVYLSEKSRISIDELIKPYVLGFVNGRKEREQKC
ncbi:MAG: hypothetical protein Q4D81_08175 [Eubacteriales bacterium]|nr:hypothetical protein [Eubacteriales bacterium]